MKGKLITSIKLFVIILLTFSFLNDVYSQPIEAATKYTLNFTGKVKVNALPDGYYGKNVSIDPILKTDKQGIYTLTMYEGTIVELGVKQTKDLTIRQSKLKKIYTSNYQSGLLGISFNDELGKASSYEETITLQLADYNVGSKHPGEKYGPKLTLKVVVKKLPEQVSKYRDDIMTILNANGYLKNMSDLQKVVLIYDWITNNVVYDFTLKKHSIENALYDRTAVCDGYAYLFYEMCQIVGVDVGFCSGTAGIAEQRHAWNLVKLGELWYYVDTTWDAKNEGTDLAKRWSTYYYFLKGSADFSADHTSDSKTSLNVSKENFIYPDWIWKAYAKRRLEVERREYNDYSVFLNTGFDSWVKATIKEYNEEYHENTVYEELTASDLQYYKEWYETEKAQYSVGFMEWIGFHSEEAYIDYECIKLRFASQPTNKEEESKAFEAFYDKYPEEIDTYEFEEE